MKWAAVGFTLLVVLALSSVSEGQSERCRPGSTLGFAALRTEPAYRVGSIPSRFTDSTSFFQRRFNCLGRSAQVRRVDLGVYDVLFPGLAFRVATVTAYSQEGVSASVFPVGHFYRVTLRGPLIERNVATRRDVPFSIVIS